MSARRPRSRIDGFARPGRPRRGRLARVLALTALTIAGVGLGLGMIAASHRMDAQLAGSSAQNNAAWIDRAAAAAGLVVKRIDIRGHQHTRESDVAAALQLEAAVSQISFDADAARRRIEALPWVLTAKVRRLLPDAVAVEIAERTPAILWRSADRDVLIDQQGRELTTVARGTDTGLPVVVGDGASPAAPAFIALLRGHPRLESRVVEARRIEDRRWTLLLTGGTELHLPGDGAAAALAWTEAYASNDTSNGLLDRGLESIDLRVPGQLVVRERGAAKLAEPALLPRQTARAHAAGGAP